MSSQAVAPTRTKAAPALTVAPVGLLQRQCDCGQHTLGGSECEECKEKKMTLQRGASRFQFAREGEMNSIMNLQRSIGNQPVGQSSRVNAEELGVGPVTTSSPRLTRNLSQKALLTEAPDDIQTKLAISTLQDTYEQGPGRVAHQVLHMPKPRQEDPYNGLSSLQPTPAAGLSRAISPLQSWPMVQRAPHSFTGFDFPPQNGSMKGEGKGGGGAEKLVDGGNKAVAKADASAVIDIDGGTLPAAPMGPTTPVGTPWKAGVHIVPTFTVNESEGTRSNTAPATTNVDTPTFAGGAAVDAAASMWRYQLKSAEGKGRINFVFYTKDHYPAPTPNDDSGDLSNVTRDNWKGIVTDLESHKTGSAGDWSAYRRTILHERYHWNTEWQGSVKPQVVKAENDIEKVGVGFDAAADAAKAEKILEPKAKKIFNDAMAEARKTYDALGDSPGDPPYVAGSAGAVDLAARVKAHAKTQKWPGA